MVIVVAAVAVVVVVADFRLLLESLRRLTFCLPFADRIFERGRTSVSVRRRNSEFVENRSRFRFDQTLAGEHLLDAVAIRRREMLFDQTLKKGTIS